MSFGKIFKKISWQICFLLIILALFLGVPAAWAQQKRTQPVRELDINNLKELKGLNFISEDQPEKKEENISKREIGVKTEKGNFKLELKGVAAESKFPISFDKTTGQLFVTTPNGERQIRLLPDEASSIAKLAGIQNQIDKIEIVENNQPSTEDEIVFNLSGLKTGKLLGLIPVKSPVQAEIGANSGKILNIDQPFWLKLLSPLVK